MPFSALGLEPALAQAAQELGFLTPTPIQAQAIPIALRGGDMLATAQTGSGKTAAYALPLLQALQQSRAASAGVSTGMRSMPTSGARSGTAVRRPRALVLVPTRELAAQVGETLRQLAQHLQPKPKINVLFGGVSINPQLMALRGGTDVLVATPGRLLDVLEHRGTHLNGLQTLVLDEADRLLDLGFAQEWQQIHDLLPSKRQTLLFSATFPAEVQALAERLLHQAERVDAPAAEVDPGAALVQRAIHIDAGARTNFLRQWIQDHPGQRMLVFVATQYTAGMVAQKLQRHGIFASPFHGGMSQGARQSVLNEFKDARWDLVITTDLAARGLDIEGLPVVVNYDLARSAVDHVHRIGRTGRAGEPGLALSLVTPASLAHWQLIQKRQGLSLPLETLPGWEPKALAEPHDAMHVAAQPSGTGGVKGRRPSKKDKLRAAAAASSAGANKA